MKVVVPSVLRWHHTQVYQALTAPRTGLPSRQRSPYRDSLIPVNSDGRPFITYILIESRATQFPICCVAAAFCRAVPKTLLGARRLCGVFYKDRR